MTISKARVLALLQPVIALLAGGVAAWLFVHAGFLDIFTTKTQIATLIGEAITFSVTAALAWLGLHQHLIPITSAVRLGVQPPVIPFSAKQVVTFLTPYISVAAGALTAWLFVHVHFLAVFHVTQTAVATTIASGVVFALMSLLTWLSTQYHILPTLFPPPQQLTVPMMGGKPA